MQRHLYPPNWEEIALFVKHRAAWVCQLCRKQCRRPGEAFDTHRRTATVSHRNHRPRDCRLSNLVCACAPCHLRYDAAHKAAARKNPCQ